MHKKPVAAGKSSFGLIDKEKFFSYIDMDSITNFIDLACGIGNYSLGISEKLKKGSSIYAIDLWEEGIETLKKEIISQNINNINPSVSDIRERLPFAEESFDACLMATIIHDLSENDRRSAVKEACRVVKKEGILYVVEFKKILEDYGPRMQIRIDEGELMNIIVPHGFKVAAYGDIGQSHYIMKFQKIE